MINDLLDHNLKIVQNKDFFKFSIDSVLLAEFVDVNYRCKNIIDLCTGNAPIPLILSEKFDKNIIGVEIQKNVFNLAKESIELNNRKNINLINDDVKNVISMFDYKFDIITCNPPYFKYNNDSISNKVTEKSIARHEIMITLEDIISISSKIINYSGSLYLVHRTDRLIELINLLNKYKFGLRKIQFVYNNKECDCCFVLVEAKYMCKDDLKVLKPLFIRGSE